AATGPGTAGVINAGPGGGTSNALVITIDNPVPALISLVPDTANRLQTLDVIFTRINVLTGGSSVSFSDLGITLNGTSVDSATQITANITITAAAATGAGAASVINAAPGGGTSAPQRFTVTNPVPALISLVPDTASRLQTLDV